MSMQPEAGRATLASVVIGEIRAEMGRRRVNQSALAARLGEAPPWVSRRLNGDVAMTLDDLERIATALRLPPGAFLRVLLPRLDSNQQPAGFPTYQVRTGDDAATDARVLPFVRVTSAGSSG